MPEASGGRGVGARHLHIFEAPLNAKALPDTSHPKCGANCKRAYNEVTYNPMKHPLAYGTSVSKINIGFTIHKKRYGAMVGCHISPTISEIKWLCRKGYTAVPHLS